MRTRNISVPELGLFAMTRAMAGAGIGLLIADRFKPEQRRTIGRTLLAVGIFTTLPIIAEILLEKGCCRNDKTRNGVASPDEELAASRT